MDLPSVSPRRPPAQRLLRQGGFEGYTPHFLRGFAPSRAPIRPRLQVNDGISHAKTRRNALVFQRFPTGCSRTERLVRMVRTRLWAPFVVRPPPSRRGGSRRS